MSAVLETAGQHGVEAVALKESVKDVLEREYGVAAAHANGQDVPGYDEGPDELSAVWSVQGLGMLRMYLGEKCRLHVWDDRYRVPDVTMLHDHPWDFDSVVVAGLVHNYRYLDVTEEPVLHTHGVPYMRQPIICGPGGGVCDPPVEVLLLRGAEQLVPDRWGQPTYKQTRTEIHESLPDNGTVTIIERTFHEDTETAHVYYPKDGEWVSAEPRPAHADEVIDILGYSLDRWFR